MESSRRAAGKLGEFMVSLRCCCDSSVFLPLSFIFYSSGVEKGGGKGYRMRAAVESFNARGKLRGRLYGEAACVFGHSFLLRNTPLICLFHSFKI